MKVYTVIPAYNEDSTIGQVVEDVQKICANIVVVDDGSRDKIYDIAKQAGVNVLRHIVNRGQGAALQTGITYALQQGAEIIVTFDADGQHDAGDIPALIKPIQEGVADVVLGTRFGNAKLKFKSQNYKMQIPLMRRIILKFGLLHQWFFTGVKVTDASCGLRAFSRHAAQEIEIRQDRMAHASEILEQIAKHKLRFVEVPVHILYTPYSLQKGQKNIRGSLRVMYEYFVGRVV